MKTKNPAARKQKSSESVVKVIWNRIYRAHHPCVVPYFNDFTLFCSKNGFQSLPTLPKILALYLKILVLHKKEEKHSKNSWKRCGWLKSAYVLYECLLSQWSHLLKNASWSTSLYAILVPRLWPTRIEIHCDTCENQLTDQVQIKVCTYLLFKKYYFKKGYFSKLGLIIPFQKISILSSNLFTFRQLPP